MKRIIGRTFTMAIGAAICYGCTNTEPVTASETTVPGTATEASADSQHPMDADTDMSSEGNENSNLSADNEIGRNLNIVALLQQNENLSTFLELIRAADLVVILESPAPYTVFAPTNEAFANLPSGTLENLKAPGNKMELTNLIQAHVLPNRISSAKMENSMPMKTAMGEEVVVSKSGTSISVGGARIITPDVQASNGIVHVVDKVLVPPQ